MDQFTVSLAEIPIGIQPISPKMQKVFTDYLSSGTPRFIVAPSKADLEYERTIYERRNMESLPFTLKEEEKMEVSALLRLIANRIPEYDAILFHGSAIAFNGKAYLFAARSGTGKTTHTQLWLQQLPKAYVLNGDKPFLKIHDSGQIFACGTPWQGKERLGCSEILPLEAICLLERSEENHISLVTPKDVSNALLHQVHLPEGAAGVLAIQVLNRIIRGIRLFRLGCNMEPEAARVSIRAMVSGLR